MGIADHAAIDQHFGQLIELIPHAAAVVSRFGIIALVNTHALECFGYERGELIGKPVELLIPLRFQGRHSEHIAHFFNAPGHRPLSTGRELFGLRKDGTEFPVEISLSPLESPEGLQAVASIVDITKRRAAEEDLNRVNQSKEALNKELESFAYSVSHDLRAPLRAIVGFGQILLEEHAHRLDGEGLGYLNRIVAAGQRMGDLIDGLLTLSRIARGPLNREIVDLSALGCSILEEKARSEPLRKVDLLVQDSLRASVDPRLIRVLLTQLLDNAWKFTAKSPAPRIEFGSTRSPGNEIFYVRDNGAGFDVIYADKLFGAFQRLHNVDEFPGAGVGLATAQRIVNLHGGRIWADSKVQGGATFYFTL